MGRALISRSVLGRLVLSALIVWVGLSIPVATQVPGQNVNMISVDRYLQKQNEVEVAISPLNPCHILAAANDYRTVDNQDLNTDGEIGDSWIGVYVSTDCGETWLNYIMPGYRQPYSTAADPVLRFGPGGAAYLGHIQFNRNTNWGKVSIARYLDYNNVEGVPATPKATDDESDPYASPVGFLGFVDFAKGAAGQFIDKPSIAVAPGKGKACKVTGGTIPSTNVYMAWAEFLSNSVEVSRSKIYVARSTDCGNSLDGAPVKLSEGYPLSQGTAIAVDPSNPNLVYVAWRQIGVGRYLDAIMVARSTDGGKSFTKARPATSRDYRPFDQPTTSTTFRTTAFPAMVIDETGRLYLAYADRVGPSRPGTVPSDDPSKVVPVEMGTARILLTSSTDGVNWEFPVPVDGEGFLDDGHQIMPALAYAGGKLNVTWYDLRYDVSGEFKAFADEKDAMKGAKGFRHTLDIRAAQGDAEWPPTLNVYGVSDLIDTKKKVSLYHARKGSPPVAPGEQLNFNRGNLKLYSGGTLPFIGDYIGTAGVQWVPDGKGGWAFNGRNQDPANAVLRTFQTAWADNRDAIVGEAGDPPPDDPNQQNPNVAYVKPGTACSPGSPAFKRANSRNANVYTSRVTPGLYLSALGNTKPTDLIERAFAITVENGTSLKMMVKLEIVAPPGVKASFAQPATLNDPGIDVEVDAFSSTARTVYVGPTSAAMPYPRVVVKAAQQGVPEGEAALQAAVVLNGDPNNPLLLQPGNTNVPVVGDHPKDTHNPRVEGPRVEGQGVRDSSVKTPRVEGPRVEGPRVEGPRVEGAPAETPRVEGPRVEGSAYENHPFSDITYGVTNDGNTTSAFNFNIFSSVPTTGYAFQLIGWRPYYSPVVGPDCTVHYTEVPQVFYNQPLELGEFGFEGITAALMPSVVIRPGETVRWTLRAFDISGAFEPFCTEPVEGEPNPGDCDHKLTGEADAQALNTDEAGSEDEYETSTWPADREYFRIDAPLPIPPAAVGTFYSADFNTNPGTATSWSVTGQPSGLSIDSAGVLSGTPTPDTDGQYSFQVTASDGTNTDSQTFTMLVVPQLVIDTLTLADAAVGYPYTQQISASGGTGTSYTWETSGVLPAGLVWGASTIWGVPTVRVPLTTYTVTVTDPGPPVQTATRTFTLSMPVANLTYVVDNSGDWGPGTLRQAIIYANANTLGFDTIKFAIPGTAPHTITLDAALPILLEGVLVDGKSQSGYVEGGPPLVEVRGNFDTLYGLGISGPGNNSTIRGLLINGANGVGIRVYGGSGVTIEGNYIGTDASGTAKVPNWQGGISVYNATNTTIRENLISGQEDPRDPTIETDGIYIGTGTTGTQVLGNRIGTNAAGTAALGNAGFGIKISGDVVAPPSPPTGTVVADNVISGNELGGIVIQMGATGTIVERNKIGTGTDTTVAIGNLGSGVEISESPNNRVGIGVFAPYSLSNTIANNGRYGIQVWGVGATGNYFRGNEIRNNAYMGIDLNGDYGVTGNDVPDVDTILNFPVITSADAVGGTTHVNMSWYTTPNADVWVEIFANPSCDSGGYGEGAEQFDAFSISTSAAGLAAVARTLPKMPPHSVLTATVTMYNPGPTRTSEFSACYTIPASTDPTAVVAAYPSAAPPSAVDNFLIMATVSPGANPPSTGITLTADLSPIGGPSAVSINDLGIMYGCDDVAGDGTYIGCGRVGAVAAGSYVIPVTVTDAQGRTSSTSFPFTVLEGGTGDVTVTAHDSAGAVLPGLTVELTSVPPGTTRTAGTDGGGTAAFPGLPAGTWNATVVTVPPGTYGTTQFQLSGGQTLSLGIYSVGAPAAPVGLTIYDSEGTVVSPGVTVTVTDLSSGVTSTYTTDLYGSIPLLPGLYEVQVGTQVTGVWLRTGGVTRFIIRG